MVQSAIISTTINQSDHVVNHEQHNRPLVVAALNSNGEMRRPESSLADLQMSYTIEYCWSGEMTWARKRSLDFKKLSPELNGSEGVLICYFSLS